MEPVGKLDEHNAYIVIESKEDPFEILRLDTLGEDVVHLVFLLVVEHDLDFGQALHEARNLVSEEASQVIYSVVSVLHNVVEKGGANGFAAEPYVAYDYLRHGNRVEDIRLAGAAADILVGF